MKTKEEIKSLIAQMTLEEKASLCSGLNFWNTKPIERLSIPSIMLTDGPHGLRKQSGAADHLGINASVPATCFPPSCATSCSFDRELLSAIGRAIGEECVQEAVSVILGPGVNIKRSPLCGRNFEYFSEDPVLSGELGAALIRGVESTGTGTSLKHFAANNQEKARMSINAVIDPRALNEIYLKSFEIAVKKGQPSTVMCAYNLLNGTYCCENKLLLTTILREHWGFDGVVVTDWGAMDDRVQALESGLELEMPASNGVTDKQLIDAVRGGALDAAVLDLAVERLLELILRTARQAGPAYSKDEHHALARRAAAECAVLLKNDDALLPIKPGATVALLGDFAKNPRYQGAGSSKINPHRVDSIADALTAVGIAFDYAPGYCSDLHSADDALIAEACCAAKGKDIVIIAAGLPDEFESEGFDRTDMNMPESHNRLIAEVAKVNPNVTVVLMTGSAVLMPWIASVKAVLNCMLTGQGGGGAIADLLTGVLSPSGKLSETYPLSLEDTPCRHCFPGGTKSVEYRESIFVGYRYYDSKDKAVLFPFGHGLSYTTFAYKNLSANVRGDGSLAVKLELANIGGVAGAEVAQIYLSKKNSAVLRPKKELKDFAKVYLAPGESKTIELVIDREMMSVYNTTAGKFAVEGGEYEISVGSSCADIRLSATVSVEGDCFPAVDESAWRGEYDMPAADGMRIGDTAFAALYGKPLPPAHKPADALYTANDTINDIIDTPVGQQLLAQAQQMMNGMFGTDDNDMKRMFEAMLMDLPLRAFGMLSQGAVAPEQIQGLLQALNAAKQA